MITRILRLIERLARLLLKCLMWLGASINGFLAAINRRVAARLPEMAPSPDGQVRSLSGLVVALLALVFIIMLWSTRSGAAIADPIVQRYSDTNQPAPVVEVPVADVQPEIVPTDQPEALDTAGTIVFSMYAGAQQDIFALSAGDLTPARLTNTEGNERAPVWGPSGTRIAFSSNRDGNWEIYTLDILQGETTRVTYNPAFESAPSWSPDGQLLVYESYNEDNLDIYIVPLSGESDPIQLTENPGADFSPAWRPNTGREIVYTSWRNNNHDIFLISLDNPTEVFSVNLTNTPEIDEGEATWNPDGTQIAYTAREDGMQLVYVLDLTEENPVPTVVGQGHSPAWSEGGRLAFIADQQNTSIVSVGQIGVWDTSLQTFTLPSFASDASWAPIELPDPLAGPLAVAAATPVEPAYTEQYNANISRYQLALLPNVSGSGQFYLSDRVDDSFASLRTHVAREAGWDFLGTLDRAYWGIEQQPPPGQAYRNWHKAARAFDVAQSYYRESPPMIEVIPYYDGPDLRWELYVRASVQDGSLGEPLHQMPWDLKTRTSDTEAYENGGSFYDSIPEGYYVNFTEIARLYGWHPAPSHSSWYSNWTGILFWQYEKRENLDWWSAMREIYSEELLQQTFGSANATSFDNQDFILPTPTIEGP